MSQRAACRPLTARKVGTVKDDNRSRPGEPRGKQPWFGPRASGLGYRPQAWPGYLVMAVLAAYAIFIGTLAADHHSLLILIAIAPAAFIPRIIALLQQR